MRSRIFLISCCMLSLFGCQNAGQLGSARDERNDMEITSTYPYELQTKIDPKEQTSKPEQVAVEKIQPTSVKNSAVATAPMDSTSASKTVLSNWQPNEGQLIRGREIMLGLQREKGHKPTDKEMLKSLQAHMGLSAPEAQQLVSVLNVP